MIFGFLAVTLALTLSGFPLNISKTFQTACPHVAATKCLWFFLPQSKQYYHVFLSGAGREREGERERAERERENKQKKESETLKSNNEFMT